MMEPSIPMARASGLPKSAMQAQVAGLITEWRSPKAMLRHRRGMKKATSGKPPMLAASSSPPANICAWGRGCLQIFP
ncbi:MAG: hypothetical protein C4531_17475 [Desulfurivibrio sp.]|jgi:hypothetical protein|nr:MAG: hypothetical protein C4531_17475 [Desulfurivibrio sp.]